MAAVAEAAGVSPETVYLSAGSKRGLLEGVMDITGPHESVAEDKEWWDRVAGLPTAADRLDSMVEYSCRIMARTERVHAIIRGAADQEAFAADLGRRLLQERLANQTDRIRRYLGDELRPGLSVDEAGQRYACGQPRPLPPAHGRDGLDRRPLPALAHRPGAHRAARAAARCRRQSAVMARSGQRSRPSRTASSYSGGTSSTCTVGIAVVGQGEYLGAQRAADAVPPAEVLVDGDPHRAPSSASVNSRCSLVRPRRMKVGT